MAKTFNVIKLKTSFTFSVFLTILRFVRHSDQQTKKENFLKQFAFQIF